MRGPELVPLPGPAEDEVTRDVREIGDGPVRVASRVRGLAAAVRLDPLAHLAVRVGRTALLQVTLLRHVAVGSLAVDDPLASDHAGKTDVDRAPRRLDVQPDAKAREKDGCRGEHPHRPERLRRSRRPVAPRDPETAQEQVDERRIGERRAPEDLALVEETQRDREREQRQQIEVAERARPAQVGQAEQEDTAERGARPRRC